MGIGIKKKNPNKKTEVKKASASFVKIWLLELQCLFITSTNVPVSGWSQEEPQTLSFSVCAATSSSVANTELPLHVPEKTGDRSLTFLFMTGTSGRYTINHYKLCWF